MIGLVRSAEIGVQVSKTRGFILRFMSAKTRLAAETESRAWIATCGQCGRQRSVWDLGGLRYKAKGEPKIRVACEQCGHHGMQRLIKAE